MKFFKYLLVASVAMAGVLSCQKQLDFEGTNGVSDGTLKADGGGNCLPSTVYGSYKVDSTLTNANYIDVQVNASFTGTYDISSDTVNGYSFKGTGSIANPGLNTVRLFGSGKPIAQGLNTFIVRYGTSTCAIGVTVVGAGGSGGTSVFTLAGAPGGCTNFSVTGTTTVGVPLNASNTVTITVDVTTIGTFSVATLPINGITYSATGTYTATGPQTITLNGSGTPIAAGINALIVTAGTSTCVTTVTTLPAGTPAVFTMGGTPGNCTGFTVNGTYAVGTPLTAANTVTMDVNVSATGTYAITSNLQNGIIFSATGTFTTTGPQTVTLIGNGVPLVGGAFNYTATGAGNSCIFSINATGGAGTAVFLLNGAPANCTGAVANGTYTAGAALTATNTVTLNVTVATPGSYSVSTNTQNGISFSAAGNFTTAGPQTITLTGTGTPTAAGAFNYSVSGSGIACTFSVNTVSGGPGAVYTLGGAPSNCTGASANGTYTQGIALTASNTVTLNVNVTTTGTYTISTTTSNGISFSKSGSFATTGPQTVVLNGSGTPSLSGNFNFPATGTGTGSSCSFSINCLPGTPPNTDYFPLTQNSFWSYDLLALGTPVFDSIAKRSDIQSSISGNTYRNFKYGATTNLIELAFFRKQGNDYYQYINVDTFSFIAFDTPQFGEILFLKENAAVNTTWESAEFTGNIGGVPGKIKYTFKIELVNTNLTVNSVNYTNVIKVAWKTLVDDGTGGGYVDDTIHESYYAQGIGLIKYRRWDATGPSSDDLVDNLRYYQIQ
jgi:hypothetical protein